MNFQTIFYVVETLGICTFAISGLLRAREKDFDPVGMYIIACATALGGGTLRDVITDVNPVYWISHWEYPVGILGLTFLMYLGGKIPIPKSGLIIADAMGLALFTVTASQIALAKNLPFFIVAVLAVMTATFGGLLRDVMCRDIPMIFQKVSFYATVSFSGAWVYMGLAYFQVNITVSTVVSLVYIFGFRMLAVRFNWRFR